MSSTNDKFINLVENNRAEWVSMCKRLGVKEQDISEVIQKCYITLWKYAKPEKVTFNGNVSRGYMFFALRSAWFQLCSENNKNRFKPDDNVDSLIDTYKSYNDEERVKMITYENQLKAFSDDIIDQLSELSTHHARFYKIYTSGAAPSYRELERVTGISYATFWNDMNRIKDKIKTKENQLAWDSINHNLRK